MSNVKPEGEESSGVSGNAPSNEVRSEGTRRSVGEDIHHNPRDRRVRIQDGNRDNSGVDDEEGSETTRRPQRHLFDRRCRYCALIIPNEDDETPEEAHRRRRHFYCRHSSRRGCSRCDGEEDGADNSDDDDCCIHRRRFERRWDESDDDDDGCQAPRRRNVREDPESRHHLRCRGNIRRMTISFSYF